MFLILDVVRQQVMFLARLRLLGLKITVAPVYTLAVEPNRPLKRLLS
jgi:hypothetical protein